MSANFDGFLTPSFLMAHVLYGQSKISAKERNSLQIAKCFNVFQ